MYDSGVHDAQRLKELQSLSLERKVRITQTRIMEWYYHYRGNVYVSFSGGKDSTVLLDLARRAFSDIQAVFVNTGLEYPEIQKFAKSHKNVIELRPKMRFDEVISRYGYPIISKEISGTIDESRNNIGGARYKRLHGEYFDSNGNKSLFCKEKYLPLEKIPVNVSARCCQVMKKEPIHAYDNKSKKHAIIATQAQESIMREKHWIKTGCNAFSAKYPHSNPMSFWTEQDVLQYINRAGLHICSVYGDIVYQDDDGNQYDSALLDGCKLHCTGCQRTGCIFCAYGFHLEKGETRFQRLAKTHPRQYEYCIGGGQWVENPKYDATIIDKEVFNPKQLRMPSKAGLGMGKVFDMCNEIYGKNFMRYK